MPVEEHVVAVRQHYHGSPRDAYERIKREVIKFCVETGIDFQRIVVDDVPWHRLPVTHGVDAEKGLLSFKVKLECTASQAVHFTLRWRDW